MELHAKHRETSTDGTVQQDQSGNPSPRGRHAVPARAMLVGGRRREAPPTLASPKPPFVCMRNTAKLHESMTSGIPTNGNVLCHTKASRNAWSASVLASCQPSNLPENESRTHVRAFACKNVAWSPRELYRAASPQTEMRCAIRDTKRQQKPLETLSSSIAQHPSETADDGRGGLTWYRTWRNEIDNHICPHAELSCEILIYRGWCMSRYSGS